MVWRMICLAFVGTFLTFSSLYMHPIFWLYVAILWLIGFEPLFVCNGDGWDQRGSSMEVAKVDDFKYLGSTVQSNGECGREVKKRVQAGWNGWRWMSGVICDRRVPARVKGKVYKVAVRPAMLYGLETVALTKIQEAEMEVAELKMLRFSLGVTRMDKIRNEYIRGTAQVGKFERKLERQDWDGMDTYGGKIMGILGDGCWGWSCQERGNGEGQKGGLRMWWKRIWLRLKWRRKIQLIETTEEGKSAVATPDGKSRKKKKILFLISCFCVLCSCTVLARYLKDCTWFRVWSPVLMFRV